MKKLLFVITMVLGLLGGVSKAAINIKVHANVCPAIEAGPTVWNPYVATAQGFWEGASETPTITPAGFHAITAGDWRYLCLSPTGSFPMWLGSATPGGQQWGNGIAWAFEITTTGADLVALADVKITIRSWDFFNSLGSTQTWATYFPEVKGTTSGGASLVSGPSTVQAKTIRSVGPRSAYAANSQSGVNTIRDFVTSTFGISCLIEVKQNGIVVAAKQLDIPFGPEPVTLTQVSSSVVRVNGNSNEQYRLEWATSPAGPWQSFGLPVSPGNVSITPASSSKFYRAFQGR